MLALTKPKPKPHPLRDPVGQIWDKGLELKEKKEPQIQEEDQVKIEVLAGGICGTDLGIYHSKDSVKKEMAHASVDPITIGHEFCGRIYQAGNSALEDLAKIVSQKDWVTEAEKKNFGLVNGKVSEWLRHGGNQKNKFLKFLHQNFLVSAEMHLTCNHCKQCLTGQKHACPYTRIKGIHQDGAFASFLTVPISNLVVFKKEELPVEIIAFMDALGNAVHSVSEADVLGNNVAILGCGVQGLMATAVARVSGAAKIFVTGSSNPLVKESQKRLNKKFSLAKKLGADFCFDVGLKSERQKFIQQVKKETKGAGVDSVLEMSGNYRAYQDALDVVRNGGKLVLLGLPEGEIKIDFSTQIIFRGITIKGIIGRKVFSSWETMTALLKSGLAKKLLDLGFVSHQFDLKNYERGFKLMQSGEAIKVLLRP